MSSKIRANLQGSNPFGRDSETDNAEESKKLSHTTNPFGRDSESAVSEPISHEEAVESKKNNKASEKFATTNPFGRDSGSEMMPPVATENAKNLSQNSSSLERVKMLTRTKSPIVKLPSKKTMAGGPDGSSRIFCQEDIDLDDVNDRNKSAAKRNMMLASASVDSESGDITSGLQNDKDDGDDVYHAIHFGTFWMWITIFLHVIQFCFLLGIGSSSLHPAALAILLLVVLAVPVLLLVARYKTRRAHVKSMWSSDSLSVDQETDVVPNEAIYLLSVAALLEGLACAIYPVSSASSQNIASNDDGADDQQDDLSGAGFNSFQTLGQILSFASITFYAFHRIIRPANRLDPLRTILELEAVSMCWDAMDGASLYELLVDSNPRGEDSLDQSVSNGTAVSARFLMTFWYLSIGIRVAAMYSAHLTADSPVFKYLLPPPLSLSPKPTVDRTLSGIRLKSVSTALMATAQFFAAGLRLSLWSSGKLSNLQQEMMVKNILFLLPVGGAVMWIQSTQNRDWNTRDIFAYHNEGLNIHIDLKKPVRSSQMVILRYVFAISYVIVGILMSTLLAQVSPGGAYWYINIVTDIILCLIFWKYCANVHKNSRSQVIFPKELAIGLGVTLLLNLFVARVPAMYWYASDMDSSEGSVWSYTNALLIVLASIVPISSYVMFWSISNMLFHADFTACPGQYNAIHDPGNTMVISTSMVEGALDIVSATSLLSYAEASQLPRSVDGGIILFAFLELCNSCQSFMLLVQMSAGVNDTPAHLVKWRSSVRLMGGLIDLGVFLLRLSIWIRYNIADSVFLVKNLCSLIQTVALVERSQGIAQYTPNDLFVNFVLPRDWYGIESEEEWLRAIAIPRNY